MPLRLIVTGAAELLLTGGYASAPSAGKASSSARAAPADWPSRGDEPTAELSARASGDAPPDY